MRENFSVTVRSPGHEFRFVSSTRSNTTRAHSTRSRALTAVQEALRLLRADHRAGTVDYLQILVADGQLHQAQIASLEAAAQRLEDTVALYAALGGGWHDEPASGQGTAAAN
ncbi:hypothetical protein [Paraburkholderia sp. BR10879]|uniref:hypothetical protein n=1 Tax=Paraburkholderia sp. BR10879 TaxID=3236990 RepID=UPI00397B1422